MFTFLQNILSGKNATFYDTFRVPHRTMVQALGRLPPPGNPVQFVFLQRLKAYLDVTCEFTRALFYGFNGNPPLCTAVELRNIGHTNGERLFCMILVGLIRYSLVSDRQFADQFCSAAALLIPAPAAPGADRLASALSEADPKKCERALLDVMHQFFPSRNGDPVFQLQFEGLAAVFAVTLKQLTLDALNSSVGQ